MDDDVLRGLAKDCVHCGFCLPACPTYQLWGEEMDSPRGRIHLLTQVLDGATLTEAGASHFDRCLGCMACMTACPSGVQYDQLIEAAREWTATGGSWQERVTRALIFALFPYPRRLRMAMAPLRVLQRTGLDRRLADILPSAAGTALRMAPRGGGRRARLPERVPARGRRRAVVGMLTGCVQSVFFPGVNLATARVLAAEGCDVIIPRDQGCCGALSLHSGRRAEAASFGASTVSVFSRAGVDAVVVNSAGCGSAMKAYSSAGFGVRDLSEFLVELGPVAERHPLPVVAAYHDACHLLHAQGIGSAPRSLLRAVPELSLVELADAGTCCGSAGVYNLLQPSAAAELGSRKADAVVASGASLVISANPGCTLQIAASLRSRGSGGRKVRTAHTAEVLDASLRGVRLLSDGGGPDGGTSAHETDACDTCAGRG
jgi:glycolate oxidase iron-sulfur subunit